eukprot:g11818.t1
MLRALQAAGLGEIDKIVLKATYQDLDAPKHKHVEALLEISLDGREDITVSLVKRLSSPLFNVVLKTLVVIHRLTLDGNVTFLRDMTRRESLRNKLLHFMDDTTREGRALSPFTRLYASYLAAKIAAYKDLGHSKERLGQRESVDWAKTISCRELVLCFPVLQFQFGTLLDVTGSNWAGEVPAEAITLKAIQLLLRDARRLYPVLCILTVDVLDHVNELQIAQLEMIIKCCRKHQQQNTKFAEWCNWLIGLQLLAQDDSPAAADVLPANFFSLLEDQYNSRIQHNNNAQDEMDREVKAELKRAGPKGSAKKGNRRKKRNEPAATAPKASPVHSGAVPTAAASNPPPSSFNVEEAFNMWDQDTKTGAAPPPAAARSKSEMLAVPTENKEPDLWNSFQPEGSPSNAGLASSARAAEPPSSANKKDHFASLLRVKSEGQMHVQKQLQDPFYFGPASQHVQLHPARASPRSQVFNLSPQSQAFQPASINIGNPFDMDDGVGLSHKSPPRGSSTGSAPNPFEMLSRPSNPTTPRVSGGAAGMGSQPKMSPKVSGVTSGGGNPSKNNPLDAFDPFLM